MKYSRHSMQHAKCAVLEPVTWILFLVQQIAVYSMYVAVMAFFARVSDPAVGGTYMTLLNTLSNLGGNWPSTLALWMVDSLTYKQCSAPGLQTNVCVTAEEVEVISRVQRIVRQCRWRFQSSGMWCCLVVWVLPDIWKSCSACITGPSFGIFVPLGPEDEGITLLQNVRNKLPSDAVSHPRRFIFLLWISLISYKLRVITDSLLMFYSCTYTENSSPNSLFFPIC
jgi:hypothetical protein